MVSPAVPIYDVEEEPTRGYGSVEVYYQGRQVMLPLAQVKVDAYVSELVANVAIRQTFQNPYAMPLEAVYVFPMAPGGAVNGFTMRVGNRLIKGEVQERQQARENYNQALSSGKRSALLEQERDDVFTVQVGNLPPGEEITVEIQYSEKLCFYANGKTELRLPMVVAPRYTPGTQVWRGQTGAGVAADTNLVPDASRVSPPRLAPGAEAGVDLQITVNIMADDIAQTQLNLTCSQHAIRTATNWGGVTIALSRSGEKLNRDFILQWQTASRDVRSSVLSYTAPNGESYGILTVLPPFRRGFTGSPRDVLFLLDRSGSMNGLKMVSAVRACALLLNTLTPADRFAIQAFDNVTEWMPGDYRDSHFSAADFRGIERGERYLRTITARGGTELDAALANGLAILSGRSARVGRRATVVLLTDGEVTNESAIIRRIQMYSGDARVFTVGIDTAVNSGLLNKLANIGGGTCALVPPGAQLEDALAQISRDIGEPIITDLAVSDLDVGLDHASIAPARTSDLFAGRATSIFFKLNRSGRLRISGRYTDGRLFEQFISTTPVNLPAIAQLWAKTRIVDIEDMFRLATHYQKSQLKNEIVSIAIKHSLLTKFTAFLAVDHSEVINPGGHRVQKMQPVEMPTGWLEPAPQLSQSYNRTTAQNAGASWGSYDSSAIWGLHVSSASWGAPPAPGSGDGWNAPAQSSSGGSGAPMQSSTGGWGGSASDSECRASSPWCDSAAGFSNPGPQSTSKSSGASGHFEPGQAFNNNDSQTDTTFKSLSMKKDKAEFSQAPMSPTALPPYQHDGGLYGRSRTRDEFSQIQGALKAFIEAFNQAFLQVDSMSAKPVPEVLEQLRQRLLQMLAPLQIGSELPVLQRFLRANAMDLIACLRDNHLDSVALKMSWSIHNQAFQDAKREADHKIGSFAIPVNQPQKGTFWEDSV